MNDSKYKLFTPTNCITEQTMFDYMDNRLSSKQQHAVEKHLLDCELCSDALEGLILVKDREHVIVINRKVKEFIAAAAGKKTAVIGYRNIIAIAASLILLIGSVFFFRQFTSGSLMDQKRIADIKETPAIPLPVTVSESLPDSIAGKVQSKIKNKVPAWTDKQVQKTATVNLSSALNETGPADASPVPGQPVNKDILKDEADKKEGMEETKKSEKKDDSSEPGYAEPAPAASLKDEERLIKENVQKTGNNSRAFTKSRERTEEKVTAFESITQEKSADTDYQMDVAFFSDLTDSVYAIADEMPEFPGGNDSLLNFISSHLKYPDSYRDMDHLGTVQAEVVIDTKGNIIGSKITRSLNCCPELDQEALRVIRMMPKWKPGKEKGIPVIVRYNFPIHF